MSKLNFPGSVTHLSPFYWNVYEAPAGASFAMVVNRGAAVVATEFGAIPASGNYSSQPVSLPEGDYTVDVAFNNGEVVSATVVSSARPTFHWGVDYGAKKVRAPVLRPIKFGDGYEQSVPNGLNNNPASWPVTIGELTDMEARQIMLFLDSFGGHRPFWWRDPDGKLLQYKCTEYERTYSDDDRNNVTATFKQYFG